MGFLIAGWTVAWMYRVHAQVALVFAQKSLDAGDQDEAILILGQASAEDPFDYEPYRFMGRIYAAKGDLKFALKMYEKSLELLAQTRTLPEGLRDSEQQNIQKSIDDLEKQLSAKQTPAGQKTP